MLEINQSFLPVFADCRWGWGYARTCWRTPCKTPAPSSERLSWWRANRSTSKLAHLHKLGPVWSLSRKHLQTHHLYLHGGGIHRFVKNRQKMFISLEERSHVVFVLCVIYVNRKDNFSEHYVWLPSIAMTSSSWMTSNDPETTKQRVSTLSPMWKMRSPGAQCVVWNSTASERRQPSLASRNAGWSLNTCLLRWTQMSARMSLGQIERTWKRRWDDRAAN